jgi:hypothetical protein
MADADAARPQARERAELSGTQRHDEGGAARKCSGAFWADAGAISCADGKARLTQSSIFPLAYDREWGSGSRVGILRAAGNAIVPALAAEFIRAVMEASS